MDTHPTEEKEMIHDDFEGQLTRLKQQLNRKEEEH
jgi:hypothetical protein